MSNVQSIHANAVLQLLRVNEVLAEIVFDGYVPSPRPVDGNGNPLYVLVYLHLESLPGDAGNSLDGVSAAVVLRAICHSVGADAAAARALAWQIRAALLDVVPEIDGRNCSPIHQESSAPATVTETTGTPVFNQIDVYKLVTYPAG